MARYTIPSPKQVQNMELSRSPTCASPDHGYNVLPCTCPCPVMDEDTSDDPTEVVNLAPSYYDDTYLDTAFPFRWRAEDYVNDHRRRGGK